MAASGRSRPSASSAAMPVTGNTEEVGWLLYTSYLIPFEIASMLLLVAMIGAIVLTLRHKPNVRRQNIAEQVARTKATAIDIVKVRPGQGL